jgi:hypothetical protein
MTTGQISGPRKNPPAHQSVEQEERDQPSEQAEQAPGRADEPPEPSETTRESDFNPDVNSSRPER